MALIIERMEILPKEIKRLIFAFLDPDERHSARLTSKQWYSLIPKAKYILRIASDSALEAKMKQLAQMPDQLALKFAFNTILKQKTIENNLTKLQNLVSLDLSARDHRFRERQTLDFLDRLKYLKIYQPTPSDIKSLTRIKQLNIICASVQGKSFNFSTTIEDLTFKSVILQKIDPDYTFKLSEHHSRLTRIFLDGGWISGQYSSLTKLTNLRDLRLNMRRMTPTSNSPIRMAPLDLHALDIDGIDVLMEDILRMTNLTKLVLRKSVEESDLNKLALLIGLKNISITYTDNNMTDWKALTNLEDVDLNSVNETGCTLESLPADSLTKLTFVIEREGYAITKSIEYINRLSLLKTLNLHVKVESETKSGILLELPNLENLMLTVKYHSMDLQHLPNLKTLVLSLDQPLQRLNLPPNLEKIYLRTSTNEKRSVRAEILPNLASLTKLKEFGVYWPAGTIDGVIHENISKMTQLENLYLNVGDSILDEELVQSLTTLTALQLDTRLKNNSGNGSFISAMTKLNQLVLTKYGCNNECITALSTFGNLTLLNIPKPSEAILINSVLHLTCLRHLAMPIAFQGNNLQATLQKKLPFLEKYRIA